MLNTLIFLHLNKHRYLLNTSISAVIASCLCQTLTWPNYLYIDNDVQNSGSQKLQMSSFTLP